MDMVFVIIGRAVGSHECRSPPHRAADVAFGLVHAGASLQAGGTVTIMKTWDPQPALDLIEAQAITTINMMLTMLGDLIAAFEAQPRFVRSVRLLTVAGSVLPFETLARARAIFDNTIANIYGLTEAAGPVTDLSPQDMVHGKEQSVGRPGRFIEFAILDEQGRVANDHEAGEIALAGPQITAGYLGQPEETRRALTGK